MSIVVVIASDYLRLCYVYAHAERMHEWPYIHQDASLSVRLSMATPTSELSHSDQVSLLQPVSSAALHHFTSAIR